MKEHSLFLLAGFPAKETEFIQCADQFREEFEDGLRKTVKLANGIVSESLREANHYLRILEYAQKGRNSYGVI